MKQILLILPCLTLMSAGCMNKVPTPSSDLEKDSIKGRVVMIRESTDNAAIIQGVMYRASPLTNFFPGQTCTRLIKFDSLGYIKDIFIEESPQASEGQVESSYPTQSQIHYKYDPNHRLLQKSRDNVVFQTRAYDDYKNTCTIKTQTDYGEKTEIKVGEELRAANSTLQQATSGYPNLQSEFVYDKFGNWITHFQKLNSGETIIFSREIYYFDGTHSVNSQLKDRSDYLEKINDVVTSYIKDRIAFNSQSREEFSGEGTISYIYFTCTISKPAIVPGDYATSTTYRSRVYPIYSNNRDKIEDLKMCLTEQIKRENSTSFILLAVHEYATKKEVSDSWTFNDGVEITTEMMCQ